MHAYHIQQCCCKAKQQQSAAMQALSMREGLYPYSCLELRLLPGCLLICAFCCAGCGYSGLWTEQHCAGFEQ